MAKSLTYLQRYKELFKSMSEEFEMNDDELMKVVDQFFKDMKDSITDDRMPTMKITNFGTFGPSIGKIKWQRKNAQYHLDKGECSEDKQDHLHNKIRKLSIIQDRLEREAKGDETWKEWRNKEI